MKNSKFDLYEFAFKKSGKQLNENSRTDLRISIMMPLKIMLFCLWYLVIDDDSKYTKVAIGINLVSWPIYHFFIVIIELQYMFDGDLPPGIRTSFYRFADQLQNFILLIEFCVLVFDQQYETAFHIVILTFLILDFVVFAVTLLYNLVNNFIRQVQYCRYLDSLPQNSQQLADRIATQIIGEIKSEQQNEELPIYFNKKQEQLKQLQQQHFQQNICSHIQLELSNQVMYQCNGDINFTISMTEDQLLMFQQNLSPQYNQVFPNLQQVPNEDSPAQQFSEKNTLGIFEIAFFIAALIATIVFIIIFTRANVENQTLKWLGILEIMGNFVVIILSIYAYCKLGRDSQYTGIPKLSLTKALSTVLQGFVCGITSIFYGVIFGIILIIVIIIGIIIFCSKGEKEKPKDDDSWKKYAFIARAVFGFFGSAL